MMEIKTLRLPVTGSVTVSWDAETFTLSASDGVLSLPASWTLEAGQTIEIKGG